ncbi:MAG: K+/H+ antiporter subunit F, partial [Idiomarina sp.]
MLGTILQIAFLLFSLSILMNLWRLVKGPDLPDRILALDTIYIN